MTALEMQQLFETELQTIGSLFNDREKPDTDTIFRYINDAQKVVVKILYDSKDYLKLKNIIVDGSVVVTPEANIQNSVYYTFNFSDYLYYINSRSKYDRTLPLITNSTTFVYNEEISEVQINQFLTTDFNKPFFRIPKCYVEDNKLRVISDAYTTITELIITYVKIPVDIEIDVNDCELDESLHNLIVTTALTNFIQKKTFLASMENRKNRRESSEQPESNTKG